MADREIELELGRNVNRYLTIADGTATTGM
jgi:hypothetical protein